MDFDKIVKGLESGLDMAQVLARLGETYGLPKQVAQAANLAEVLLNTAVNVKQLVETGKVIATTKDKAKVQAIFGELQAQNDKLAAKVAAS